MGTAREHIQCELEAVFRRVFDDDELVSEAMTATNGAVVRQSVPPGSVVMGNPAKVVARVQDMLRFWEAEMLALPWAHLIAVREGAFDPATEPELQRLRQKYFFESSTKP